MKRSILAVLVVALAVAAAACVDHGGRDTTVPGQERDTPGGAGMPRGAPPGVPAAH